MLKISRLILFAEKNMMVSLSQATAPTGLPH